MKLLETLNFNEKGLIPAIIQDYETSKVLTLGYMNKYALEQTLSQGLIYLFRRSKNMVMQKGQVSGNIQIVKEVFVDCRDNSLLFKVEQKNGACHEGFFTCFFRKIDKDGNETIVEKRVFDPKDVYGH